MIDTIGVQTVTCTKKYRGGGVMSLGLWRRLYKPARSQGGSIDFLFSQKRWTIRGHASKKIVFMHSCRRTTDYQSIGDYALDKLGAERSELRRGIFQGVHFRRFLPGLAFLLLSPDWLTPLAVCGDRLRPDHLWCRCLSLRSNQVGGSNASKR